MKQSDKMNKATKAAGKRTRTGVKRSDTDHKGVRAGWHLQSKNRQSWRTGNQVGGFLWCCWCVSEDSSVMRGGSRLVSVYQDRHHTHITSRISWPHKMTLDLFIIITGKIQFVLTIKPPHKSSSNQVVWNDFFTTHSFLIHYRLFLNRITRGSGVNPSSYWSDCWILNGLIYTKTKTQSWCFTLKSCCFINT